MVRFYLPQVLKAENEDNKLFLFINGSTPYDEKGKWRLDIVKELKACGFSVDANKIR